MNCDLFHSRSHRKFYFSSSVGSMQEWLVAYILGSVQEWLVAYILGSVQEWLVTR